MRHAHGAINYGALHLEIFCAVENLFSFFLRAEMGNFVSGIPVLSHIADQFPSMVNCSVNYMCVCKYCNSARITRGKGLPRGATSVLLSCLG